MKLDLSQLGPILCLFYEHLTPCWVQFHRDYNAQIKSLVDGGGRREVPTIISQYTCRHTSAFILKQLKRLGVEDVRPAGGLMRHAHEGDPQSLAEVERLDQRGLAGRFFDEDGFMWEPHFWLEHNDLIIDITKDQFGWDALDILDVSQGRTIYCKHPEKSKMTYLSSLKSTVMKFEGEPQTMWQEQDPYYVRTKASFTQLIETASERLASPASSLKLG